MCTTAILLTLVASSHALVGYDCGGQASNISTLSLLGVGKCSPPDIETKKEDKYVQLLQLSEYNNAEVLQCKIEIDRTIYHCGMHSHTSVVHNGRRIYLHPTSLQLCKQLHSTGMMSLGYSTQITGIRTNSTDSRSLTLAGTLSLDGSCTGSQFSDPYGTWDSVVVQANVQITLQSYQAMVKLASDQIILRSGTHCIASDGYCQDPDNGDTFSATAPTDSCNVNSYDVLYEGPAVKLTSSGQEESPIIYTVVSQETTFALTRTMEFTVCGYHIFKTEHPKLFIFETTAANTFKAKARIEVNNLDIFSYVNSKFIYVEKHLKTQMTQLYRDIVQQKCALEKQILKNALTLASTAPDEMAYALTKSPGFMAIAAGEVIHLVKCVPVEIRIRKTENCYVEFPVSYNNGTYFLTPRSHIITRKGTVRDCNPLLPVMYLLNGIWYKLSPNPIESISPPEIQPLTRNNWKYTNPGYLASSGIYSTQDLDKLRDHIMFPMEKQATLHTLARGAMGYQSNQSLKKIAESTGHKLWQWFVSFGSFSAGLMGVYIAIRLFKLIVDTVIHAYALHAIYGWSLHLIAAVWASVTNFLLHMAHPASQQKRQPEDPEAASSVAPTVSQSPQKAFEELRTLVAIAPTLTYPNFEQTFVLQTDASGVGLGAVLTQEIEGIERVVAFASRVLTEAERKYSTTKQECLAILWATKKFRYYLEGYKFIVVTDHHSLRWLRNLKDLVGRLARWTLSLLEYDFEVVHRKGTLNVVPDALSQMHEAEPELPAMVGINQDEAYEGNSTAKSSEDTEVDGNE
ncbi:uncharacterized protein LOC143181874 [Calliopsis andreniformis]|uniref:uncharacterized protein LOC143181874 n=1 Tax=Calliopsis andreniformis TaxID=337506 RepID=UPI003FCEC850